MSLPLYQLLKSISEELRPGQSKRLPHECGEGYPLHVTRAYDGRIWGYCYRCGETAAARSELTLTQMLAPDQAPKHKHVAFPRDASRHNMPVQAVVWLASMGLSEMDWERLGLGYSDTHKRLFITLCDVSGAYVGWQARGIWGQSPKWLSNTLPDQAVAIQGAQDKPVVITEDYLSAYKVASRAGVTTVPLMGTSMHPATAALLAGLSQREAIIWLDGDTAGMTGAIKARRKLELMGYTVRCVSTVRDPKYLDSLTIKQVLADGY